MMVRKFSSFIVSMIVAAFCLSVITPGGAVRVLLIPQTAAAEDGKPAESAEINRTEDVYRVPEEIPADLSEDVTDQLQEFIDSVPDGAIIEFPGDAEYLIEGTLFLSDRHDLTLDGNGVLFRSKDKITEGGRRDIRNRSHWRVDDGSSNITLQNIRVIGPNEKGGVADEAWDSDREAQHAFDIVGAEGGRAIALWRGGWGREGDEIKHYGLSTDGTFAWVYADREGEVKAYHVSHDTAEAHFEGLPLKTQLRITQ